MTARLHPPVPLRAQDPFASPVIPPRSLLARLPVNGQGAWRESLTSYLVRLARAHGTSPRHLLAKVLAKVDPSIGEILSPKFYKSYSGTVNGTGKYAAMVSGAAGEATMRDLVGSTLLGLSRILPANGAALLARHPQWCPHCLAEQLCAQVEPWRPLVWSLDLYRVCGTHKTPMHSGCLHCGEEQPFIPEDPVLAHCAYCSYPLAGALATDTAADGDAVNEWLAAALEDLVAHLEDVAANASARRFLAFVDALVLRFAKGNRARFCEMAGLPPKAISNWYNKGQRPSLPQILRIAYAADCMPAAMLLGQTDGSTMQDRASRLREVPESLWRRGDRPDLSEGERRGIKRELQGYLADDSKADPPARVALQLGITRSAMKYWFPSEFIALSKKFRKKQAQDSTELAYQNVERVRDIVERFKKQGIFPGRKRVDMELRKLGWTLADPGLLEIYFKAVGLASGRSS